MLSSFMMYFLFYFLHTSLLTLSPCSNSVKIIIFYTCIFFFFSKFYFLLGFYHLVGVFLHFEFLSDYISLITLAVPYIISLYLVKPESASNIIISSAASPNSVLFFNFLIMFIFFNVSLSFTSDAYTTSNSFSILSLMSVCSFGSSIS